MPDIFFVLAPDVSRQWRSEQDEELTEVKMRGMSLEEAERVRAIVTRTLAQQDRLLHDDNLLSETPLFQGDALCGVLYSLRGPRNVLLTAIWDVRSHSLWCYDSTGKRFVHGGL